MNTVESIMEKFVLNEINEEYISIDSDTREILIPEKEKLFGIETDKDSERKIFRCPKIIGDNINLLTHQIYIYYVFVENENIEDFPDTSIGLYRCEDVEDSDDGYVTFSWLLSEHVLSKEGYIAFKVVVKKTTETEILKKWNTLPGYGLVLKTVPDGDEEIIETYPDILDQLMNKFDEIDDIRIAYDEQKYESAGIAVRTQIKELHDKIDETNETIDDKTLTNSTSASESQVETASGAAVLTGVDGKTEQVTTTGAQLLPASKLKPLQPSGVEYEIKDDGYEIVVKTKMDRGKIFYDVDLEKLKDKNLCISADEIKKSGSSVPIFVGVAIIKNDGTAKYYSISSSKLSQSFTIPDNITTLRIDFNANDQGTAIESQNVITIKGFMLNAGSEPLPWEPYTGEVPGPNPDYQIPVQGVGGETGDESFGFNAVIQSYQLFDASKLLTKTMGTVATTNNGDGSFTISGSGNTSSIVSNNYYTGNTDILKQGNIYIKNNGDASVKLQVIGTKVKNNNLSVNRTFILTESESPVLITEEILKETVDICIRLYQAQGLPIVSGTVKPVLYQDGDGTWEPYHRSELPITLTQPLFDGDKIMQVKAGQTYVDADGATQTADRDMWGVYRTKKQITCNGSENWSDASAVKNRYFLSFKDAKPAKKVYCDHFIGSDHNTENKNQCFVGSNAFLYINTEIESLELWKQWLSEHNIKVVYELAVSYFEPFTDQSPFFGWTTPAGGCMIITDDPMEPIISADTARTPEGSYLLTGYINGLLGRTLDQRIEQLVALTKV